MAIRGHRRARWAVSALAVYPAAAWLAVVVADTEAPEQRAVTIASAGALAHVACAATGTAVGLLVARPVVTRIGWSFCIGIAVVMATAVQPWLPPVGSAVDALLSGRLPVAEAALGAGLAGAAAVVSWAREIRTA